MWNGLNLYGYVGNGPIGASDPLGLVLTFRNMYNGARGNFVGSKTYNYLSKNSEMKFIMDKLNDGPDIEIQIVKVAPGQNTDQYWPHHGVIEWDPNSGAMNGGKEYNSPAAILAHELLHAYHHRTDPKAHAKCVGNKMPDWDNEEEKRTIEAINRYNDSWSPKEQDRTSHGGTFIGNQPTIPE